MYELTRETIGRFAQTAWVARLPAMVSSVAEDDLEPLRPCGQVACVACSRGGPPEYGATARVDQIWGSASRRA
jgi:hypothetical protein